MADMPSMTSSRPYLIRALHEWISDNGMTPLLLVDATVAGVDVPGEFIEDGKIILNVSMSAVQGLALDNEMVSFRARFSGAPREVMVPVQAVLAVYARETSAGMMFPESEQDEASAESADEQADTGVDQSGDDNESGKSSGRPNLRVIK